MNPYDASIDSKTVTRKDHNPRRELLPPAIGILTISILHIFCGLYYFVFVYNRMTGPDANPERDRLSFVYCLYYGVSIAYALVVASGAFSMMRKNSYIWAMTVCILASIPLMGPCFAAALPFGIWGIIVLRRPHVIESFSNM